MIFKHKWQKIKAALNIYIWLFSDLLVKQLQKASSAMSLLLLVPGGGPDRLTRCSVFQLPGNWNQNCSRWGDGREKVGITVYAGFERSCRGKRQGATKKKQKEKQWDYKPKLHFRPLLCWFSIWFKNYFFCLTCQLLGHQQVQAVDIQMRSDLA